MSAELSPEHEAIREEWRERTAARFLGGLAIRASERAEQKINYEYEGDEDE